MSWTFLHTIATTGSVQVPKVNFNPQIYMVLVWLGKAVKTHSIKAQQWFKCLQLLRAAESVFAILHGPTICYGNTGWSQPSSLCVQLPRCCNLIFPTETPVGTAARASAILKRLRRKNQLRDSLGCIHHGHFRFPDTTGNRNHIPAGVPPCCNVCPTALCATQTGSIQHTLDIVCLTRHLVSLYV